MKINNVCSHCKNPWIDHLGVQGLCKQNQIMLKALQDILYRHVCKDDKPTALRFHKIAENALIKLEKNQ